MRDFTSFEEYELNESDIDKAIHILSVLQHKNASPEEAIDFLEWLRTEVHINAHYMDSEELIKLYDQYSHREKSEG